MPYDSIAGALCSSLDQWEQRSNLKCGWVFSDTVEFHVDCKSAKFKASYIYICQHGTVSKLLVSLVDGHQSISAITFCDTLNSIQVLGHDDGQNDDTSTPSGIPSAWSYLVSRTPEPTPSD